MPPPSTTRCLPVLAYVLALALASGVGLGCSDDETQASPVSPPAQDHFAPDPAATGPRLWLDAEPDSSGSWMVRVWAAELGDVFGWAAHLRYDPLHLELAPGQPPEVHLAPLGSTDPVEALGLVTPAPGDVGLGATRVHPDLGNLAITAATPLATLVLRPLQAGESELRLDRNMVRRADASYQATAIVGGTLSTVGGGP